VIRFPQASPPINKVREIVNFKWGLEAQATVGYLNNRHILVKTSSELDYQKVLNMESSKLLNFNVKIFKWSSDFTSQRESPLVHRWVRLPSLPSNFFAPSVLEGIGNAITKFIMADPKSVTKENPSYARMCIELDLSKPQPSRVWIGTSLDMGFWQRIIVEGRIDYCSHCGLHGHTLNICRKAAADPKFVNVVMEDTRTYYARCRMNNHSTAMCRWIHPKVANPSGKFCTHCKKASHSNVDCWTLQRINRKSAASMATNMDTTALAPFATVSEEALRKDNALGKLETAQLQVDPSVQPAVSLLEVLAVTTVSDATAVPNIGSKSQNVNPGLQGTDGIQIISTAQSISDSLVHENAVTDSAATQPNLNSSAHNVATLAGASVSEIQAVRSIGAAVHCVEAVIPSPTLSTSNSAADGEYSQQGITDVEESSEQRNDVVVAELLPHTQRDNVMPPIHCDSVSFQSTMGAAQAQRDNVMVSIGVEKPPIYRDSESSKGSMGAVQQSSVKGGQLDSVIAQTEPQGFVLPKGASWASIVSSLSSDGRPVVFTEFLPDFEEPRLKYQSKEADGRTSPIKSLNSVKRVRSLGELDSLEDEDGRFGFLRDGFSERVKGDTNVMDDDTSYGASDIEDFSHEFSLL